MKKTYLSPAIETTKMQLAFGICDPTIGSNYDQAPEGGAGEWFGGGGSAPERKPF